MGLFRLQQRFLPPEPSGKAGERAAFSDCAMTGNEEKQGISVQRASDRAGVPQGKPRGNGKVRIGNRFTERNAGDRFPYRPLKRRTVRRKAWDSSRIAPRKIPVEPSFRFGKDRRTGLGIFRSVDKRRRNKRAVFLGDADRAQRRAIEKDVIQSSSGLRAWGIRSRRNLRRPFLRRTCPARARVR